MLVFSCDLTGVSKNLYFIVIWLVFPKTCILLWSDWFQILVFCCDLTVSKCLYFFGICCLQILAFCCNPTGVSKYLYFVVIWPVFAKNCILVWSDWHFQILVFYCDLTGFRKYLHFVVIWLVYLFFVVFCLLFPNTWISFWSDCFQILVFCCDLTVSKYL